MQHLYLIRLERDLFVFVQDDGEKKSAFAAILDAIERVTGFDLDGDGTVAGDIICEVRQFFFNFLVSILSTCDPLSTFSGR